MSDVEISDDLRAALVQEALAEALAEAEHKAWNSLSRYKFQMFGYWAAIWVHLNRIGDCRQPNPWAELVRLAGRRFADD